MNPIALSILIAVIGYLFGSISAARIIFARLRPGEEPVRIRMPSTDGKAELVSHAIGATNVMMTFGSRWGMLTMALDAAKAFVPALILRLAFPGQPYSLIVAGAVLSGHIWPVWHRFSGGGGNSCILGMLLAISPAGLVVTHVGSMLIGKFLPKFAFMSGVVLMIPWFAWRYGIVSPESIFAIAVTLIYMAGQLPEIIQYARLKRAGHIIDAAHVMRLMKNSKTNSQGDRP